MRYSLVGNFLILVLVAKICVGAPINTMTVRIEEPKGSGNYIEKDLIEFVNNVKEDMTLNEMETSKVREQALMVMGLTGTGKSTLVNYLNGIPLIGKKINRKLVIAPQFTGVTLPGGFSIGHRSQSETIYPAVYSGTGDYFSYIDNPGFRDTRGLSIELANGFFRELVTKNVKQLKFLLLLSYDDLNQRGDKFRESMRGFYDFLSIFEKKNALDVSKSIGIVVTRVENDGDSDEDLIEIFKDRLNEIINFERQVGNFENIQVEKVFREIIKNNQIQIFSTPEQEEVLNDKQKIKILRLIDDLEYIDKEIAGIRVRVDQNYLSKLLAYVEVSFRDFESFLQRLIEKNLIEYFSIRRANFVDCNDAAIVLNLVKHVQNVGMHKLELNEFLTSLNSEILSSAEKNEILSKKEILNFFINFLPEVSRGSVSFVKQWLNLEFNKKIESLINDLTAYGINEFDNFVQNFEEKAKSSLSVYFKVEKFKATDALHAAKIYIKLNNIYNTGSQVNSIHAFLHVLGSEVLGSENIKKFLLSKESIDKLGKLHKDLDSKRISFDRVWLNAEMSSNILKYFDELFFFVDTQYADFENYITSILSKNIRQLFKVQVDNATSVNIIKNFESYLESLINNLTTSSTFEKFIDKTVSNLLNSSETQVIKSKKAVLDSFTNVVQNRFNFPSEKKWISHSLSFDMHRLIQELKQYYEFRLPNFVDGIYTYYGYFVSMTEILSTLKQSSNIKDLKRIQIFATHTVEFNADFNLPQDMYETNHPDLIIIAPLLIFPKKVTVNLSCNKVPDYPENKIKADNGKGVGDSGENGKPGLPGFNAGNLKIYADTIVNDNNLIFVSTGGKGGPGQSGNISLKINRAPNFKLSAWVPK